MKNLKSSQIVFVDCFDTIIFRRIRTKEVFKNWSKELSNMVNIPWREIYKQYTRTNFNMCFKKIFTSFTLQANFNTVLERVFQKLSKKYTHIIESDFLKISVDTYVRAELNSFVVNQKMISFLKEEKNKGKKIYLVSDFYCKSDIITKWFIELEIINVFDKIFSSSDFDKEKATSKLYKHLLKLLDLDARNVTMYGDNLWSDVLMAKVCKLNSKRIKDKIQRINYEEKQ